MKYIVIILIFLFSFNISYSQEISARTIEGKWVTLKPDGSWSYVKPKSTIKTFSKPDAANKFLISQSEEFGVWYNDKIWEISQKKLNNTSEFELKHKFSDGYAIIIGENNDVDMQKMLNIALASISRVDSNFVLLENEPREVNQSDIHFLRMKANIGGVDLIYSNYYYVENKSIVQLIVYFKEDSFGKYKYDLEDLLNGFVSLKIK